MLFGGRVELRKLRKSCHMTTRDFTRTTPTYVGILTCMWVQLLSPNLEDNTVPPVPFVPTPTFEPIVEYNLMKILVTGVQQTKPIPELLCHEQVSFVQ